MANTTDTKLTPIEVWLSQRNMAVTCRVVHEDETTVELEVVSLSVRGAQREITGYLIDQGYAPVGRWESFSPDEESPIETVRKFRPFASAR